jgi:hypothetical protein
VVIEVIVVIEDIASCIFLFTSGLEMFNPVLIPTKWIGNRAGGV